MLAALGAPLKPEDENGSHFRRFLAIYRAVRALGDEVDSVVRPVAPNPTTGPDGGEWTDAGTPTAILHPEAKLWAHLFNVRYRKLLVNLSHAGARALYLNVKDGDVRGAGSRARLDPAVDGP